MDELIQEKGVDRELEITGLCPEKSIMYRCGRGKSTVKEWQERWGKPGVCGVSKAQKGKCFKMME